MPTGSLPEEGKKLWEKVFDESKKDSSCDEKCAAKKAWAAVKRAGWTKDENGKWHKKSLYQEFSMRIEKASYDKATNTRTWRCVASDTEDDLYKDNMSLPLFSRFVGRIESNEQVPEQFRSNFWAGGVPYLSVSHYPDMDGNAVPGSVEKVYIDGNRLKAMGRFFDTPLGRSCFESICEDLYGENQNDDEKIRISIAFIDYKHKHKDNDFVFERTDLDEYCPQCLLDLVRGKVGNREFLDGHLIHLALTRVPVNERTLMEVEKAMPKTRKDDAASIIGDELADELEEMLEKAEPEIGKALVIKSDDKEEMDDEEESEEEEGEEKKDKEKGVAKSEVEQETEPKSELEELKSAIAELRSMVAEKKEEEVVTSQHPLDDALTSFRSAFDNSKGLSGDERLSALQQPFNELAEVVKSIVNEPEEVEPETETDVLVRALSEVMKPVSQKLDLISQKLSETPTIETPTRQPVVPERRSINPALLQKQAQKTESSTSKLRAIIERSVQ